MTDSTQRFSDRAELYERYRPGYPAEAVDILRREVGLGAGSTVADVGAGTGISSELFLRAGCTVYAVEPNAAMRRAAERRLSALARHPAFHSVNGTAEATTLPTESVDGVVAAQAFHWFDVNEAKREFTRIVRPGGWAAVMWNIRRTQATAFLRDYEALLLKYASDYQEVERKARDASAVEKLFGPAGCQARSMQNEQVLDREALHGRLISSSYMPNVGEAGHEPMLAEADRLFDRHQHGGTVRLEYDTRLYFGRLKPARGTLAPA